MRSAFGAANAPLCLIDVLLLGTVIRPTSRSDAKSQGWMSEFVYAQFVRVVPVRDPLYFDFLQMWDVHGEEAGTQRSEMTDTGDLDILSANDL